MSTSTLSYGKELPISCCSWPGLETQRNCLAPRRHLHPCRTTMSALFNFESLLCVVLLLICTCTYIRSFAPSLLDRQKTGPIGTFWKMARIGERKSPWVAAACVCMALNVLFWS
ncbi:hypothetical protein O3P69_005960 [Scylla paramamosain]|uniref:Protein kish n=1 Tax=Scylla paramamosain TaxID=85552 RepID=A0AAW0U459_SCYPA